MTDRGVAAPARLEVASLTKSFGAVRALRSVSLALAGGEVVALVGENGAGKSTLIKILAGIFAPDAGAISIDGVATTIPSPADAIARGIAVIHQERMLCDNLSIAANLFLGREPLAVASLGWIDRARRDREAKTALERVGLDCDPRRPLASLGPAARQLVEIARALRTSPRFVVMDEPTSSLDRRDTARLLELVEELRRGGVGVLYVSHRLGEIVRVADRAVVLRDGVVAGEVARGAIDAATLVRLMVGDAVAAASPALAGTGEDATGGAERAPVLIARELRLASGSTPVSFALRAGEILGLFGLIGAGRTELIESLFGLRPLGAGTMSLVSRGSEREHPFAPRSPADAIAAGLAMVPEDRKTAGVVAEMSISDNLALAAIARRPLLAWRDRAAERRAAAAVCTTLDIRPPRPEVEVGRLSGGNQQKVAIGKWLAADTATSGVNHPVGEANGAARGASLTGAASTPRVFLLDEPTRGVDVGARAEIHRRLQDLASRGVAILLSSAETEEILALADRVLVLRRGAVAGVLDGAARTEEALLRLAAGAEDPAQLASSPPAPTAPYGSGPPPSVEPRAPA